MRLSRRFFRNTVIALGALLLTLLLLLAIAVATPVGSRVIVWQLESQLDGLRIEDVSGSVLSGLTLKSIHWAEPNTRIEQVTLNLSAADLLVPQLVVQELAIQGVTVSLPSNTKAMPSTAAEPSAQEPGGLLPSWLPPIYVDNLRVDQVQMETAAVDVAWHSFHVQAQLVDGAVTIGPLRLAQPHITLKPTKATPPKEDEPWPLAHLAALGAPLPITLTDIAIVGGTLVQGDNTYQLQRAELALDWQGTDLNVSALRINAPDYGQVSATTQADLTPPYTLDADIQVTLASGLHPKGVSLTPIDLTIEGDLSDLSARIKETTTSLDVHATANLVNSKVPFQSNISVNLNALQPLLPPDLKNAVQWHTTTIQAQGSIDEQSVTLTQPMLIKSPEYQNGPVTLSLDLNHRQQQLTLHGLNLVHQQHNRLSMEGTVDLGEHIQWQLTTVMNQLAIPSQLMPANGQFAGRFEHQGQRQGAHWQVVMKALDVNGELNQLPFSVRGNGQGGFDGQWFARDVALDVEALELQASITGQVDEQWQLAGQWHANDLTELMADLTGTASGQFKIDGEQAAPQITFDAMVEKLEHPSARVDDIHLTAHYQPAANHGVSARLELNELWLNDRYRSDGQITLEGNLAGHQLNIDLDGDWGAQLTLAGQWQDAQWQAQLNDAALRLPHDTLTLDHSVNIVAGDQTKVSQHCWQGDLSQWCLQDDLHWPLTAPATVNADIAFGDWLTQWLDQHTITGQAALAVTLRPDANTFAVDLSGNMTDGYWHVAQDDETFTVLEWQQGQIDLQGGGETLAMSIGLDAVDGGALLSGNANVDIANKQLDSSLTLARFDLNRLLPILPSLSSLEGTVAMNLNATGPLTNPNINGTVNADDLAVKVSATQTEVQQGQLTVNFEGRSLDYRGRVTMGDGQANITGDARWRESDGAWYERVDARANVTGERLRIQALPELKALVSPDIDVTLTDTLTLRGGVTVDSGQLTIQQLPASAVSVSDDMVIEGQEPQSHAPLPMDMELDIAFIEPFGISAFDFEGAIDGQLQARQKGKEPLQLFGNLGIPRGQYEAYGQNLVVQDGRLQFVGTPSNPVVQLSAVRPIVGSDVTAGLRVTGPADSLSVKLFSDPVMDQQAVLAYILTGRGPDDSGPDHTTQNQALLLAANQGISLTGGTIGDALNKVPVVSDVTLDTEASARGDTMATVSGYIGERIFVKYGVGIIESVNELTVRYYLLDKLWLEALSGIDQSVDMYYQFTIDDDDETDSPDEGND